MSVSVAPTSSGSGVRPTTGCPTLHSLTPPRKFAQHGDGKYMIASHIHRWPFWLPRVQRVTTSQQRLDKRLWKILSTLHRKGRYSLWCGWEFVAQQTGTSGGVGRLHCNSYSTACTVFPYRRLSYVHISTFVFLFFSLCYAVLSFPFCITVTWSVNKLQYKQ